MIKIVKEESDSIVIESEDTTLTNLVSEQLWNVKGVKFAGAFREHPYLKNPNIVVKASDPRKALETAGKKIIEDIKDLKEQARK